MLQDFISTELGSTPRAGSPPAAPGCIQLHRIRHDFVDVTFRLPARIEHFQEKWNPVFRPKMRQRKNAGAASVSSKCETALEHLRCKFERLCAGLPFDARGLLSRAPSRSA
jgi:hypothetical protein